MPAASRNMSACSVQAVSQVGCRLIVASSAKTSRPRLPGAVEGPSPRNCSTKACISGLDETGAGLRWESLLIKKFYTEPAKPTRFPLPHRQMATFVPGCKTAEILRNNVVDL